MGMERYPLRHSPPGFRQDFWQLVDHLTEKDIWITRISTNGYLLNEDVLEKFNNRGLHPDFTLSYDGIGYHDWQREVDSAEVRTLTAITAPKNIVLTIVEGTGNILLKIILLVRAAEKGRY